MGLVDGVAECSPDGTLSFFFFFILVLGLFSAQDDLIFLGMVGQLVGQV